ncbi:MAG: SusE domain-containing protein [Ferruginibacter sp.]
MKKFIKIFLATAAIIFLYTACHKVDDLPSYGNGSAVQLSSSVSSVAAAPADSNTNVVAFSWTDPKYAQDPSLYKFVIEIDSATRNFTQESTITVVGKLSDTLTAKQLNTILLGFGFSFNVQYTIDVRVTSSYGNNNEQYKSNTIQLQVTPYKVPPKIELPASGKLFLVGDASQGGWNNPVPVPTQELARLDETTFAGVFDLIGGKQYLLLPVNGDWTHKYSVATNTIPGLDAGGDFGYDQPDNFPGPATSGMYLIIVNFQTGKFTVSPYTGPPIPATLFMVGSATPGGWNNPVPTPSQEFTRLNSVEFEISSIPLAAASEYLLLPVNGDWTHKYSVPGTFTGTPLLGYFGYDLSNNIPGPAIAGDYKVNINFAVKDPEVQAGQFARFTLTKL